MLQIEVPGWKTLRLEHLVLDLNGTLAVDGHLLDVGDSLGRLAQRLTVQLLSADTHGTLDQVAASLGVEAVRLDQTSDGSEQKARHVAGLGADSVVAIGNGANDRGMLELAALAMVVIGAEGCALSALTAADVVVASAENALNLLLEPRRLVATLRS
ncbi:MAG: HAD family hydrolase [Candidatus Dormibacteria bacterium]|jgi:soluble P-type ATPase